MEKKALHYINELTYTKRQKQVREIWLSILEIGTRSSFSIQAWEIFNGTGQQNLPYKAQEKA